MKEKLGNGYVPASLQGVCVGGGGLLLTRDIGVGAGPGVTLRSPQSAREV